MSTWRRSALTCPSGQGLAVLEAGPPDGRPVVLLHGLTMTGEEVLKSTAALERRHLRVVSYDARGHGRSERAAARSGYTYELLIEDLAAVLDALVCGPAVLVGNSMGCHTALRLAIEEPERVAALAVVSPAYDPAHHPSEQNVAEADEMAHALREQGVAGAAFSLRTPPGYTPDSAVIRAANMMTRRRLEGHLDLMAVADALQANIRSKPFESLAQLGEIKKPTLVVGTRDQFDLRHPFALARAYAHALGDAPIECEPPGRVPLAWGGRRLTALVAELAQSATWSGSARQSRRSVSGLR